MLITAMVDRGGRHATKQGVPCIPDLDTIVRRNVPQSLCSLTHQWLPVTAWLCCHTTWHDCLRTSSACWTSMSVKLLGNNRVPSTSQTARLKASTHLSQYMRLTKDVVTASDHQRPSARHKLLPYHVHNKNRCNRQLCCGVQKLVT